jgi:hypothetical protein
MGYRIPRKTTGVVVCFYCNELPMIKVETYKEKRWSLSCSCGFNSPRAKTEEEAKEIWNRLSLKLEAIYYE